jgi:hypothetical protein
MDLDAWEARGRPGPNARPPKPAGATEARDKSANELRAEFDSASGPGLCLACLPGRNGLARAAQASALLGRNIRNRPIPGAQQGFVKDQHDHVSGRTCTASMKNLVHRPWLL